MIALEWVYALFVAAFMLVMIVREANKYYGREKPKRRR